VSRLGVLSLLSSIIGTVALLGDVVQLVVLSAPQSPLEVVFSVANIAGFLFGLISRPSGCACGAAGLHLSWTPVVITMVLLAAYEPVLAASLARRTIHLVLALFGAVADLITALLA
jgi:hypothetical protein